MVSIEVIQQLGEEDALLAEWDHLAARSVAGVFSYPAWYAAWRDAFPINQPRYLAAREGGELVGILPLDVSRGKLPDLYLPFVVPFARGDYQPVLVQPDRVDDVLPRLLEAAMEAFPRQSVFLMPAIPEDSPTLAGLRDWIARKRFSSREQYEVAPRMSTLGLSYQDVEQRWSSDHRKQVRKHRRRMAERGETSLWRPETLEEALAVLPEFFEVHDHKWQSQGLPGRFQDPAQRVHFERILVRLWGRGAFFSTVRCGDVNVSYQFGFLADGWIQNYRRTYRYDYQQFSPGTVHLSLLAEYACEHGLRGIDFLLGAEQFKSRWSTEEVKVYDIVFTRSRLSPAYAWLTTGKPFVRAKLGMAYLRLQLLRQRLSGSAARAPARAGRESAGEEESTASAAERT